jgi:hypothetical protein
MVWKAEAGADYFTDGHEARTLNELFIIALAPLVDTASAPNNAS